MTTPKILEYKKGGMGLRSVVYVERGLLEEVITHLYTDNRLVMRIALATGLRVGDILELRIGDIRQGRAFPIIEHKTGKKKLVRIPAALRREILATRSYCSEDGYYAFPHRLMPQTRHRTRSAVNKDILRVLRDMKAEVRISPHTARKGYAVELYARTGDMERVQQALNHSYITTTLVYALSDKLGGRGVSNKPMSL